MWKPRSLEEEDGEVRESPNGSEMKKKLSICANLKSCIHGVKEEMTDVRQDQQCLGGNRIQLWRGTCDPAGRQNSL